MMNQAASATRRPSGSTATAGCCPMLVHPQFFVNTFSAQAPLPTPPAAQHQSVPQCHLSAPQSTQSQQFVLSTNPSTGTTGSSNASQALNQPNEPINSGGNLASMAGQMPQPHSVQPQAPRSDQQSFTSLLNHPLPIHQLLASRHSTSPCMALAAALAAATYQTHQQFHLAHQQQHQAPINQSQQSTNTGPVNNPAPQSNTTNQVPPLNFNSYNAAQPFLGLQTSAPLAAHLNLGNNNHHQPQSIAGNPSSASSNPSLMISTSANTGNQMTHPNGQRPLSNNTTLNSAANHQNNYRNAPQLPIQTQTAPSQPVVSQQPGRGIMSDSEVLGSLLNEHFQAIMLSSLITNQHFPPTVAPAAPLQPARHVPVQPTVPVAIPSVPGGSQPLSQQQQQVTTESSTEQAHQPSSFQPVQQSPTQARISQHPAPNDYQSPAPNNSSIYQQNHQPGPVNHVASHHASESMRLQQQAPPPQLPQSQPQSQAQPSSEPQSQLQQQQQPQQQQPQQQQPQQQQPQHESFAHYAQQVDSMLAILQASNTNLNLSANTNSNLNFISMLSRYLFNHGHLNPHPPNQQHFYNNHLNGPHHPHHGLNGQNNGQDDTMLTMSESKPRGLNRAEIDSLTPYIQMNEKDPRSCVICLSKFELKSKIRPLPCNHAFHAKCVDKWLRANRTCPICRRDALKTYSAKIKRI